VLTAVRGKSILRKLGLQTRFNSVVHGIRNSLANVFVISYPKSGRTWLRMLLARLIALEYQLDAGDFTDLEEITHDYPGGVRIKVEHDDKPHRKRPEELEKCKSRLIFGGKRVVYLFRDPRDVLVSNFFQATRRDRYFSGDISEFIRHERFGLPTILTYMNTWYSNRDVPAGFFLLSYEQLHRDTFSEIRRLLDFLELDRIDDSRIEDAIAYTSFENMQEMERRSGAASSRLRPSDIEDRESFKVRKGKIGGYVDYLNAIDIEYVDKMIDAELRPEFGYCSGRTPSGRPG
jgi:hypothetical protein